MWRRKFRQAGGRAKAVAADVSKEAECEKLVRGAREAFGAIHILVNNAGILGPVAPAEGDYARAVGRSDRHQPHERFFDVATGGSRDV